MQLFKDFITLIFKLLLNIGFPIFLLWALVKILGMLNPWVAIVILILLIAWWIALLREAGVALATAGCTLITYRWIRRDKCVTTGCARPCIAIKGPYPKIFGPAALFSQDVACICAPNAPIGFGTFLQKVLDSANTTAKVAALYNKLIGLLINEPDTPRAQRLRDLIEKINNGEELSEDEQRFVDEVLAE